MITGYCFSEFVLDSFLSGDHADIDLVFYGEPIQDPTDRVVLFTFSEQKALRYWEIGPQHSLYLPEPWIRDQNRLALFDEEGKQPGHVYILRDGRCPFRKVLA